MAKKEMTGMDKLLEAVRAAINSAAPSRRDALAKIITAYHEDSRDEYRWATGPQAPTLLSRLMVAVTPGSLAQPKQIRNPTPMRDFLYNACFDGMWPVQCIEGYKNWETGPIRFFYEDFRSAFHAWCKRSDNAPGGKGISFSRHVLDDLYETFPQAHTRLRLKLPADSLVHRTPSDARAQAVEIPSLRVCRKNFDDLFKSSQDWTERARRTADGRRDNGGRRIAAKSAASVKRDAHFRPGYRECDRDRSQGSAGRDRTARGRHGSGWTFRMNP